MNKVHRKIQFPIYKFQKEGGQGLIEATLAIALVLSLAYALVNLGVLAMRSAAYASDRAVAARYMQEGLEILRANRDETDGWSALSSVQTGWPLCFEPTDPTNLAQVRSDCYEITGEFNPNVLVGGRYERTFAVENVNRLNNTSCPIGCGACGPIVSSGGFLDNCSRKVTVQVAWPGVTEACNTHPILGSEGRKYCVVSSTILTNWKK